MKLMGLAAVLAGVLSASCAGGGSFTTGPGLNLSPGSGSTSPTDNDSGSSPVSGSDTVTVITTGNGGNGTGLNLPGGGGLDTDIQNIAYSPQVTVPASESFANNATAGDDDVTGWLKNCLETLPDPSVDGSVYQNASLAAWADAIFDGCNQQRAANGLAPLVREDHLDALAQSQARDMGLRDYFGHDCPDGVLMWDRWMAMKVPYANWAGENAAMGQESASEVVVQWMQSPGHRRNLLQSNGRWAGVGVYFDATDRDMPVKVIMEYADFRDDPASNAWYERGDVYRGN